MAVSPLGSAIYGGLFPTGETARLFTDSAEVRAMLLVEGALARVQGDLGVIPADSAAAIHRAAMEAQIDPAALGAATAANGVVVPGLVAAFRREMGAPEHAQYVHWGATSQDIIDTALMLRLGRALDHAEDGLKAILQDLAALAEAHADLPMAARTYGQHATPTTFGAVVAGWGWPLLDLARALPALREGSLFVSLSGAAGTSSALGPKAAETRAGLARALGLQDPGRGWHTDRGPVLRIGDWFAGLARGLAKMGADLGDLTMTGIGEVRLAGAGASSTMPQKQNPVAPSALVALHAQVQAQAGALGAAAVHRGQRDGAAWFAEWLALPPLVLGTAAGLGVARRLADAIRPDAKAMGRALDGGQGLIHAEALSFALAAALPRPDAQAAVKRLCAEAGGTGARLGDLAARDFPALDLAPVFDPARQTGTAPADARAFAAAVRG